MRKMLQLKNGLSGLLTLCLNSDQNSLIMKLEITSLSCWLIISVKLAMNLESSLQKSTWISYRNQTYQTILSNWYAGSLERLDHRLMIKMQTNSTLLLKQSSKHQTTHLKMRQHSHGYSPVQPNYNQQEHSKCLTKPESYSKSINSPRIWIANNEPLISSKLVSIMLHLRDHMQSMWIGISHSQMPL